MMRALVLALVVCLSGCATLREGSAVTKLAVQVAAMKVIEADSEPHAKAAKIIAITEDLKKFVDMDGVTIADLKERAMLRVYSANLEPSDFLLASALVDAVALELDERVGSGVISAEHKTTVNAVLSWVSDAARFY